MQTEKRRRFIINVAYWAIALALIYCSVKYLLPLLAPFVLAFLIAFALRPLNRLLCGKCRLRPKLAAVLTVILFYLTVGALFTLAIVRIFLFLKDAFLALPAAYTTSIEPALLALNSRLNELIANLGLKVQLEIGNALRNLVSALGDVITTLSVSAVGAITTIAAKLPAFLVSMLMTIISSFFFAVDYDRVVAFVLAQLNEKQRALVHEVRSNVTSILFQYVKSYSLIMFITFCELSLGLSVLRVNNAIPIALLIAIFDILPVLGTGGIMIPWMIIRFINGDYRIAVGLLVVYLLITVIRNIIEPKIVGKRVGLPPLVTLMAMFVGTALFGFVGLFGLPIALAILNSLNAAGVIHLFRQPKSEPAAADPPAPAG